MIFSKLCGALTGKSSQPATMLRQELERWESMLQDFAKGFNLKLRKSKDYVSLGDALLSAMQTLLDLGDAQKSVSSCLCAGVAYYKGGEYYKAIDCWKVLSATGADDASLCTLTARSSLKTSLKL